MRRYGLFALLLAILLVVFPAAVNAAERDKQNPVVKCQRPAVEYLKDAEKIYKERRIGESKNFVYLEHVSQVVRASLELYKVCSELEKGDR